MAGAILVLIRRVSLSESIGKVRRKLGERIWDVGNWVYAYAKHESDDDTRAWWTMEATFQGTEVEADAAFDALTDMACGKSHHRMDTSCNFRVGGMRRLSDAEVNGDDE